MNDYDHWDDLANPISDVEAIAKDLKDLYGFETEIVRNPDRKTILDKIEVYRQKTYAKDAQLLIFFSGHGEFNEATKQGYFVPKNGQKNDTYGDSYLEYEGLKRRISSLPCEHILLALDACYSGTADESIAMRGDPGKRPGASADAERERYISASLQYKTRIMLTSGAKVRTPDKSQFVFKFLEALRSQGGDDRLINTPELVGYLTTAIPKPVSGTFGDHTPGGEFLFIQDNYKVSEDIVKKSKETTATADDLTAWRAAKASGTESAYQNYLSRFPGGQFRDEATVAVQAIQADGRAWTKATSSNTIESYQEYLDKFPNGAKRAAATTEIRKLEADLAIRRDDLAWDVAVEKNTEEAFKKYQKEYPKGKHIEEAKNKISNLKTNKTKNEEKKENPPVQTNYIPPNAGPGRLVEIETSLGTMIAELYDGTPQHRDNFIKLAQEGYYNDLLFHRVIKGFIIQGGDPNSRNAPAVQQLGFGGPSYQIPAEFIDTLYHLKGALCAARTNNPEKKSSGSQFYIVQGSAVTDAALDQIEAMRSFHYTDSQRAMYKKEGGTPHLDREYTVFGRIISGLEVIDKIADVQTIASDRPSTDIKMKMRVLR